jgi:hypothetical protein
MEANMALNIAFNAIPAGSYDGVISDVRFHHSDIAAVIPTYTVEHEGTAYSLSEYLLFDAPSGHPRYNETAKGKGRILTLLGPNPTVRDHDDLAEQLLGIKVRVGVGTRMQDGLPVPKVVTVSRAEPLASQPQGG